MPADEELSYRRLIAAIVPEHRKEMQQSVDEAIEKKKVYQSQYQVRWPDGSLHWIKASGKPQYDAEGNTVCLIGVIADVTEQENYQQELQTLNEEVRASNEELAATNEELIASQQQEQESFALAEASRAHFQEMIQASPVAMLLMQGEDLILEEFNVPFLEIIGKDSSVKGKPCLEVLPELKGQPIIDIIYHTYRTGEESNVIEAPILLNRKGSPYQGYFNITYTARRENGNITGIMQSGVDVTEQDNARRMVEQAEENLRTAIDSDLLGTFSFTIENGGLTASPRARELFGFLPEEEMTIDTCVQNIREDYRHLAASMFEKAITEGTRVEVDFPVINSHDGKLRWLRSSAQVQQRSHSQDKVYTGILLDITEQKADDLRKNDFIGMVSHELKTPLTSLSAIVQMANGKLKDSSDSFLAGAMGKATLQVKKMSTMINGFLNISRLESGKLLIVKQEFGLDALIKEIIEENSLLVSTHIIQLAACNQVNIHADRDKIGSVISNFLSNAIKYSPKGDSIEVYCKLVGKEVEVSVKDQGMGIKPQDIYRVFDRYNRVESNAAHISGFGIGLYLCSEIIAQHEGKIWVESQVGVGSTFFFSLPVQ